MQLHIVVYTVANTKHDLFRQISQYLQVGMQRLTYRFFMYYRVDSPVQVFMKEWQNPASYAGIKYK